MVTEHDPSRLLRQHGAAGERSPLKDADTQWLLEQATQKYMREHPGTPYWRAHETVGREMRAARVAAGQYSAGRAAQRYVAPVAPQIAAAPAGLAAKIEAAAQNYRRVSPTTPYWRCVEEISRQVKNGLTL